MRLLRAWLQSYRNDMPATRMLTRGHDAACSRMALMCAPFKSIAVSGSGRFLFVQKGEDALLDLIRDTIVDLGIGLVRLEQSRRRLEELFQPPSSITEVGHAEAGRAGAGRDEVGRSHV